MRTTSPSQPLLLLLQQGLKHRVLCAAIPAACALGAATLAAGAGDRVAAALAMQFCLWALLGFSCPLIWTGVFSRPFPPSQHLALFKVRTQKLVLVLGAMLPLLAMASRYFAP